MGHRVSEGPSCLHCRKCCRVPDLACVIDSCTGCTWRPQLHHLPRVFVAHGVLALPVLTTLFVVYHDNPDAGNGNDASLLADLLSPSYLAKTHSVAAEVKAYTASVDPTLGVIGGEVGPAYGGGRDGVTNVFADAFWYLDHLGTLAMQSIHRFYRSTLIGGDYEVCGAVGRRCNTVPWFA